MSETRHAPGTEMRDVQEIAKELVSSARFTPNPYAEYADALAAGSLAVTVNGRWLEQRIAAALQAERDRHQQEMEALKAENAKHVAALAWAVRIASGAA